MYVCTLSRATPHAHHSMFRQQLYIKWSASLSHCCARARIFSAHRMTGRSTTLPSTTHAPMPSRAAAVYAATMRVAKSTSARCKECKRSGQGRGRGRRRGRGQGLDAGEGKGGGKGGGEGEGRASARQGRACLLPSARPHPCPFLAPPLQPLRPRSRVIRVRTFRGGQEQGLDDRDLVGMDCLLWRRARVVMTFSPSARIRSLRIRCVQGTFPVKPISRPSWHSARRVASDW